MTHTSEVLADSPLLAWSYDETSGATVADFSGNSRAGTASGGYTRNQASDITSETSKSILLDGIDGLVTSSYNPFSGTRTFEGLHRRVTAPNIDALWGGTGGTVALRLNGSDVEFHPNTAAASPETWAGAWPGTGVWVYWHFVFAYVAGDHGTAKLFINGTQVGSTHTSVPDYNASPGNFMVGARGGPQDPGNFLVDHTAIYSGELSAGRMGAHIAAMAAAVAGAEEYWSVS